MATTTPPGRRPRRRRPPPAIPVAGRRARPASSRVARPLAAGALALVVLIVAYLLFAGGGGTTYKLLFAEANQLVRGDQVQVGGVPVGSIKDIVLTKDYKALITIHVDSSLTPLHEGTTAQVRVPSLTSVANRYIALTPGPNNAPALPAGSTLPTTATHGIVDLDQLFDIFNPQTRRGAAGGAPGLGRTVRRDKPRLRAVGQVLQPVAGLRRPHLRRARPATRRRSRASSWNRPRRSRRSATTAKASRASSKTPNKTFQAVGTQQAHLQRRRLHELPVTLRQGNKTFAALPPTLDALTQLGERVQARHQETAAVLLAADLAAERRRRRSWATSARRSTSPGRTTT